MKFYEFKCWIENAWRFRKSLSTNFISDTDTLLLDMISEIIEEGYKYFGDPELEECNRIDEEDLENLQIARDDVRLMMSMYSDSINKELRINKIESTFKFIGRHLYDWGM